MDEFRREEWPRLSGMYETGDQSYGGPFRTIFLLDVMNNRIWGINWYVFFPNGAKHEFLREARHRLDHHVVRRSLCIGAIRAVPADRAVDEARVALLQRLVPEAESIHHLRAIVLDEHVCLIDECEECLGGKQRRAPHSHKGASKLRKRWFCVDTGGPVSLKTFRGEWYWAGWPST